MKILLTKFKETVFSVLPIVIIVLIMHFTFTPLENDILWRFIIGSVLIIVGLTIFIMGVDTGITPIGNLLGRGMARSNKLWIVITVGLIIGIIITVAEPSLLILANQVQDVTGGNITSFSIVIFVSVGTGVMLSIGIIRIVYAIKLRLLLLAFYGLVLLLSFFSNIDFLAISFDASGATTGALAVPFILAIAGGTSRLEKNSESAGNDSFGLVGISSIGAILAVLVMGVIKRAGGIYGAFEPASIEGILSPFLQNILLQFCEVLIIFFPILLIFLAGNHINFKLDKITFFRVCVGVLLSVFGLTFFLLGVNQGFMEVGLDIGAKLASQNNALLLIVISFILGVVTILAEPAVHILTHQIEEVTSAYVKAKLVLITLAIGVGFAIILAMLRVIVPGLQFWHLALPGFALAIIMSFFAPNLFVGIAFDSGGVASGPMTATFVLAFVQGAAHLHPNADVLADGFGVIAMVAMTPLIALQVLGILFKYQKKKSSKVTENLDETAENDDLLSITDDVSKEQG